MCVRRASWRLELCLSFRAGESGLTEVLAGVWGDFSKASQVVSWKGLPSRFAQGKFASAGASLC
eukprot:1138661-Pelagomonas_calceolata.AAC.2